MMATGTFPPGRFPIPWFLLSVVKVNGRRYGRELAALQIKSYVHEDRGSWLPGIRDSGYNRGYVPRGSRGCLGRAPSLRWFPAAARFAFLPGEAIDTDTGGEVLRPYVRLKDCYYNDKRRYRVLL